MTWQVAKDPVPGQLWAGGAYGGGPCQHQGEPTSSANSANYESPGHILSLLETMLSVSRLAAHPASSFAHSCVCPCQPGGRQGPGGTHAGKARQPAVCGWGCVVSDAASRRWCCHCLWCCLSPWPRSSPPWPVCYRGRGTPATPSQHCTHSSSLTTCSLRTYCRGWSHCAPQTRPHSPQWSACWCSTCKLCSHWLNHN